MNQEESTIRSFTGLRAWQERHMLVLSIYKEIKDFPSVGAFGLTSQLRRIVVSITSNIAEGFSRNSFRDKIHFWNIALGSLTEVQNQLLIARDVGHLTKKQFDSIADQTVTVSKILNGLIKATAKNMHLSKSLLFT